MCQVDCGRVGILASSSNRTRLSLMTLLRQACASTITLSDGRRRLFTRAAAPFAAESSMRRFRLLSLLAVLCGAFGAPPCPGAQAWAATRVADKLLITGRQLPPQALNRVAEQYAATLQHAKAATARAALVTLARSNLADAKPFDVLKLYAALSQDLKANGSYSAGVDALREARSSLKLPRSHRKNAGRVPELFLDASLLQMKAELLDCSGQSLSAIRHLDAAHALLATAPGASTPTSTQQALAFAGMSDRDLLQLAHLLHKAADTGAAESLPGTSGANAIASAANAAATPDQHPTSAAQGDTRTALAARFRSSAAELVRRGPWWHPAQLPAHFIASLPRRTQVPWHCVPGPGAASRPLTDGQGGTVAQGSNSAVDRGNDADCSMTTWPFLQPLVRLLRDAAPALAAEYRKLQARKLLQRETDCIHSAVAGGGDELSGTGSANATGSKSDDGIEALRPATPRRRTQDGRWQVFTVNGPGHPPEALDEGCCNVAAAPVACALLRRVAARVLPDGAGPSRRVTVVRGGYSSVGPHSHLRPHFGITNAQIKLHVGLIVPQEALPTTEGAAVNVRAALAEASLTSAVAVDERGEATAALGPHAIGDGAGARSRTPADVHQRSSEAVSSNHTQPCSHLRVANETRAWTHAGQVWAFDDSWEHELHNRCGSERVIFQLVLSHPDLPPAAASGASGGDAGSSGADGRVGRLDRVFPAPANPFAM
jgi:hypothetical protein